MGSPVRPDDPANRQPNHKAQADNHGAARLKRPEQDREVDLGHVLKRKQCQKTAKYGSKDPKSIQWLD